MADDPIIQMASDPDFGKLPLSEQRKALAAHDPGFGKLGDGDISGFVRAHQELQLPDTAAQSAAQTKGVVKRLSEGMQPSFFGGAYPTKEQNQYIDQRLPMVPQRVTEIRKQAGAAALSSIGGELGIGWAQGLPWYIRSLAGASGAGAGAGIGSYSMGASPKEALATGSKFAATSLPLEAAALGLKAARGPLAQIARDPMTGKVRTPWEIAVDKVLPDPYAPNAIPAKPIPKGTNYGQFLENQKIAAANPPLGSAENPGLMSKLPVGRSSMPKSATPPRSDPFAGAISSNASLPGRPLPSAGAYAPPSANVPGVSRQAVPIKTSPFGNATPSNALNADIPLPQAGAYSLPAAEVPGLTSPYAPPTGIKGSIAKPSGRLILSPEEARAESVMQGIAKTRASQHGTLYAAGMRPAGGGRVPLTPTATETFEYPQRSAYDPPDAQYSRTGGAEGPYSPPSYAYRVHDADVGPEDFDLNRSHAHATTSPEEAVEYQSSRNPGTPQAISKNDLSGLREGVDYDLVDGPRGNKWVRFKTPRAKGEFSPHE